jgi:hypothetical protein
MGSARIRPMAEILISQKYALQEWARKKA